MPWAKLEVLGQGHAEFRKGLKTHLSTSFPPYAVFCPPHSLPPHPPCTLYLSFSSCLSHLFFIQSQIVRFAKWDLILGLSGRRLIPINLQRARETWWDKGWFPQRTNWNAYPQHLIWAQNTQSKGHVIHYRIVKDGMKNLISTFW